MAELILSTEEKALPFVNAETKLLGQLVRQMLETNPEMQLFQAAGIIGAALNLGQYLTDTRASTANINFIMQEGDQWHIEINQIKGLQ